MLFAFLCSYIMYVCAIRFQEEAQISAVILHSDVLILAMHRSCSLTEALLALISAHQRRVIWQNFWTAAKTSVYFSSRWVLKQPVLSGLECYTANLLPLSTLMELVFLFCFVWCSFWAHSRVVRHQLLLLFEVMRFKPRRKFMPGQFAMTQSDLTFLQVIR